MPGLTIGYARVSTDARDRTAQRDALEALGVRPDRVYVDHGFIGTSRQVKLNIGRSVHDPTAPVGRLLFNVLAMVAKFEADLIRARAHEGMRVAKANGRLRGELPKLPPTQEAHLVGELEELFGVTRSTVYHAVRRAGRPADALDSAQ